MSSSLDLSYCRSYSPVPPPMPSPQLKPMPLPSPPVNARRPRSAHASREHVTSAMKSKSKPRFSDTDTLMFSLKDVMVVESPRRFSDQSSQGRSSAVGKGQRRPRSAVAESSREDRHLALPSSPTRREHRRSGPLTFVSSTPIDIPHRSSSRTRIRSPSRRIIQAEAPPPVPPLPPFSYKDNAGQSLLKKSAPIPIRIPELGLGLDESLRSPLSPSIASSSPKVRSLKETEALSSFLYMSKREKRSSRSSLTGQLAGCLPIRTSCSLPDMKEAKHRSNPSLAGRLLRLGTQYAH